MFYGVSILIVLYNLALFFNFRDGISDYLRLNKMSKTNIRKNKKGFKNYWFYRDINKIKSLGWMYYANIIYFIMTLVYTILGLSLGYVKIFAAVLFILSLLVLIVQIPTSIASVYYFNRYAFGRAVVLCRRYPYSRRLSTPFNYVIPWGVTCLLIYISFQELFVRM